MKSLKKIFLFLFSIFIISTYVLPVKTLVYANENPLSDTEIKERLSKKRAGVVAGTPHAQFISNAIDGSTFSEFNSFPDTILALSQNKIDFYVSPVITFNMMKDKYDKTTALENFVVAELDVSFILPKNNSNLRQEVNQYISKLKSTGELAKLQDYWLNTLNKDNETVEIPTTGSKGTIKMGTCSSMEPYSYIKNNKYVGFDIAIAAGFCKEYDYALNIENTEFAGVLSGTTTGKYDIAGCCISYTKERAENVLYCDATYTQLVVPIVRKADFPEYANASLDNSPKKNLLDSLKENFIDENRWQLLLSGTIVTGGLTILATIIGSILGFFIAMLRRSSNAIPKNCAKAYIWILQATPIVLLLMIIYYVIFADSSISAFWVSVIAFSMNFSAYFAEILRTGIESISNGQLEAALTLGYNKKTAFMRFILPQAINSCLPVYSGQIISLLKGTSIVGYISVQDITKAGDIIRSRTFNAFLPLICATLIYFILDILLIKLLNYINLKMFSDKRNIKASKLLKGVKF